MHGAVSISRLQELTVASVVAWLVREVVLLPYT